MKSLASTDSKSMTSIRNTSQHWVEFIHGPMTAWIVLAFSLLVTLIAWGISDNYANKLAEERFEFQIAEAQDIINKRFINYEQVLRGGLGLFKASNNVERDEWKKYITTLEIDKYYPGTLGVGYSKWLSPNQLQSHIQATRQEGFPAYTVRPKGERAEYSSIIFLEPFNDRNRRAFGYDMYSEPVRREAMSRARDTGQTAISGKVTLVQETTEDVQAGFLIYMPHYKKIVDSIEKRREELAGFVYSALRMGDLMHGVLGVGLPELHFTVFDGDNLDNKNLLYDSKLTSNLLPADYQPQFQSKKTQNIGGHQWSIFYQSNPTFDNAASSEQPTFVAIFGVIIDLLLFKIILTLSTLRRNAQTLADERMIKISEHETQFQAITDNANDGIISIDAQGKVNYINNSAQDLFGYTPDNIIGKSINILFPISMQETVEAALEQNPIKTNHTKNKLIELEGMHRSGNSFPIEFSLAHWNSENNTHYTAIIRDITERKKMDTIKNEFISTVSHELRTPLTAISGSLSLVENGVTGGVNQKSQELINNANRNARRLANLVNDLLDTEKMASGKMRYNMQINDIADLIKKSIEINLPIANQSNITLLFSEYRHIEAYVDPDRFIQVMTNLISNAIKYSPIGDSVEITLEPINNELRIAITDHGSGVPDEFRTHIFDKFSQADSSATRKHGGTGLGLSIAKFIVEKFNGRIDYNSEPNKETTFFFFIPIANHKEDWIYEKQRTST